MPEATRPPALLEELAHFVSELSSADLPERVRERAKLILQHNIVVALAARDERVPGQDRTPWPAGLPAAQAATRLTDGLPAPAERAVVTNSLAMGARAQHDELPAAISHFGSTVLPPLLAAAEQHRIDGAQVLTAMVAGYEVGARIGAASVRQISRRGFRPTGLYGPLAGAAAVGKAIGLGPTALTSALAFAANTSSGLTQTWLRGSDEWRYQTAFAARNGYVAAYLAAEGVFGAPDTLEGANGFHRAFATADIAPASVLDGLGERWAVEDVLLKPYPVCAFNQAPVQQVLALKAARRFRASDVERVRVRMNADDITYPGVDTTAAVRTRAAALMSLRTCIALALLHGDVTIEHLESPDTAAVRRLTARIDLLPDPAVPTHATSVDVTHDGVTADSGAPATTVYDRSTGRALMSRLQPLTRLDDGRLARLAESVRGLEELPDIGAVLESARPARDAPP
ncbi:MmgE/PrpD family protein [Actinacidiphila sp. ITFR-21]|uniref:MmgE/PrpD family protein n=1 Tax=Actinacidiphila sp. ITFR-21 TaxID=3075199 RepID=UPI00288A42BF|nr:MmgE/PrpD family protein [Streptomyces sp. ITFR-21]WNI14263.1 MmgE/PrpD family protein [Streptomyces sp. ITFR-21]